MGTPGGSDDVVVVVVTVQSNPDSKTGVHGSLVREDVDRVDHVDPRDGHTHTESFGPTRGEIRWDVRRREGSPLYRCKTRSLSES